MSIQSERINSPISNRELERRWAAVRKSMEEQSIDVLLMQNNNDFMGGNVKFFTDIPATNGYPVTVIFPKDDRMTVINQGPFGTDTQFPSEGDWLLRGVKRFLRVPSFASAPYTLSYDAELCEKALEPYSNAKIGLVGLGTLPVSLVDRLRQGRFSNARFLDATDMVDQIKIIKSEEEIAFIRCTAALQDAALEATIAAIQPGKREIEITAVAEHFCQEHGSEQGLYLACSYQPGQGVRQENRHLQNRVLRAGDMLTLLLETNGPGGLYTEIGRTCVLGKASQEAREEHEFELAARNLTLKLLKPGASCGEIWESYNQFLRENGRPEERRLYCHGQGYDLVERPLVRNDEPIRIQENMNIACHPNFISQGMFNTLCDNYLIGKNGVVERLHKFPEKLLEIG